MTEDHEILHGVKLADVLTYLVEKYGWNVLGYRIRINCFNSNPTIKSSLKFLRRTQWARDKVDELYVESIKEDRAASSSE